MGMELLSVLELTIFPARMDGSMQRVLKRAGADRRTGQDQRQVYDIEYFQRGGIERRHRAERRASRELRKGWVLITPWSSVFLRHDQASTNDDRLGASG